ncbi:hypothetical protein PFICI_01829 [Pestalotiopsis fici W106-1]|uniref:Uncharacterized protein n=1 Tax=Pestalotiopsis fici (strain W106-1 / CGMCC3.15140) TaxID=1229662 RepID=W3XRX6_PESFW|nr:uncharacterized protein PFICI_01829 [Pestalotiopsis fici W106-1]ETS88001.1 hypothetical protein PFICI_01829 [Pestalotiopsis fici W106-1]
MRVGLFKSTSSAGRPRAGHSNVRGKVISAPIPIPNPADDDEFPMRRPGTGLATPLGNEGLSKLLVPPERASTLDPQSMSSGQLPSEVVVPEERLETPLQADPVFASDTSDSPAQGRTNSNTLRYSVISNNTDTDQSRTAPQRKRSTLRTTLGRLFGRRKSPSSLGTQRKSSSGSAEQQQRQSKPSALGRAPTREAEPKRSASLPITEFDRALRSHSVGPNDHLAIESARTSYNGGSLRYRRRAATTSSKLYARRSEGMGAMAGLSPRPASTHARSTQDGLDQSNPENIGRAITSDVLMQHRRSRSLSQITNVVEGPTQRNRQDEIRYWRESYDPGFQSQASSIAAVELDNDDTGHVTMDMPEQVPLDDRPKTPPQPFDFGPLAGMRITQAASLEERVATLESRNEKLERLVAQLFDLVPGANSHRFARQQPQTPPTAYTSSTLAPALYRTTTEERGHSKYASSQHSNDSFGDGVTFIGSLPPGPGPLNRPTSNVTATVRGASSLPTLARDSAVDDRYTNLLTMFENERAARHYLEAQVKQLVHRIELMSTPRKANIMSLSGPAMTHSVFEHDDDDDDDDDDTDDARRDDVSESDAFETPREEYSKHALGAFGEELTDEDADGSRKKAARTLSLSQLTMAKSRTRRPASAESGVEL